MRYLYLAIGAAACFAVAGHYHSSELAGATWVGIAAVWWFWNRTL